MRARNENDEDGGNNDAEAEKPNVRISRSTTQ